MPIAVDPKARLSACKFCKQVFLHQPDMIDPAIDHEWRCGRNPNALQSIDPDFGGTNTGTNATVVMTQKAFNIYEPVRPGMQT